MTMLSRGRYRISERGGSGKMLSTKTRHIRAHARDALSLFIKFGGPLKKGGGGGVLSPKTPHGFALV